MNNTTALATWTTSKLALRIEEERAHLSALTSRKLAGEKYYWSNPIDLKIEASIYRLESYQDALRAKM